jgi:regulatory protein
MTEQTITALEVQQRNKERVNVFLDGEFAFGLPILAAARLHKGQTLSEQQIAELKCLDATTRAFDYAVRLLARRPYSTAEIRRKLASKDIEPDFIEEVLDRLESMGYVDDYAFARYWVENRERFRPRGPRALRYELRQKGIAPAIIDAVLEEVDQRASALRAAQKKVRRLQGLEPREFRHKLSAFLVRRGFGYDTVREVVDQLITDLKEEDPDYFASQQTREE